MARVLAQEHQVFIQENYQRLSTNEISDQIGVNRSTIKSYMRSIGISIPRELALEFRRRGRLRAASFIVHPEDELIREFYLLMPEKTLAMLLGRSHTYVVGRLEKMGLAKPPELIEEFRKIGMIKPGQAPANKGRK